MNNKLDNDLKNRIREVFDNYEDDTANAGWELLRQKFPEEKKRRVIAWWWYPAAAVMLLCLGTWFFYPQTATQQMANQPKKAADKTGINNKAIATVHTDGSVAANKSVAAQPSSAQTNVPASPTGQQQQQAGAGIAGKSESAALAQNLAPVNKTSSHPDNNMALPVAAVKRSGKQASSKNQPAANEQPAAIYQPGTIAYQAPVGAGIQSGHIATSAAQTQIKRAATAVQNAAVTDSITGDNTDKMAIAQQPVKANQPPVAEQKTDPVLKMIAADDARRQAQAKNVLANKKNEKAQSDKSVVMSLYAATYFNYAKGSENQLNVGGGFSSDFRLSGNFKISTGLSIGQNRLSYSSDNNIPQQINNRAVAMVNKTATLNAYNLVTPSLRSVGPEVKNYNASLVGLDIPLNIKYQFNPQKNDTYISAGISSGTYINETYRSGYSYGNTVYNAAANAAVSLSAVSNAAQQTQENTSSQHFSSFDFARTLNLSFGMGYPLGKNNRLVIEPFLKYPLSGLGAQDIRFGASGINLKLSFSGSKK